ncbi:hypothetical protein ABZP36_008543 [Zizania latifolia]
MVLRVQKCHSIVQTNGKVDEVDQRKGNVCSSETSSSFPDKSHEGSDDEIDLDALAIALEPAATLASNSKKQNKSKRSNAPIKCPVGKVKAHDPSLPVLPCLYIYYGKEQLRGKDIVGPNSSESVLAKEIAEVSKDEEEKWEGKSCEYDRALGADRTFLKFKKRLDAYPHQCFRLLNS